MPVLIEAFSVIVRRDAIEHRFAGGMPAFLRTIPNRAACHDDDLFRIGFMDGRDADAYVASLEACGLVWRQGDVTADISVVVQKRGPTVPSPWLEYKDVETDGMKLSLCKLAGSNQQNIAAPQGWTRERYLNGGPTLVPISAIGDRFKFLRRDNNVEVYLDLQTSKEVYSARPRIAGDTSGALKTRIDSAVHEALAIDRQGPVPLPRFLKKPDPRYQRLHSVLLPEVTQIADGPGREMMTAHFAKGIILRLVGRRAEAEQSFRKANDLRPGTIGVLRDLVRCIAEQRKPQEALPFAREAAGIDPTDVTLLGNLAACLMQCSETTEALSVVNRALELDPNDDINQKIRDRLLKLRR